MTNLWYYRSLALNFFQREISGRYVGSVSGIFWILIHPFALLGIYSVVFTTIFRVSLPESGANSTFMCIGAVPG